MDKYINANDYAVYLLEKFKSEIGKAFNRCGEAMIEYIDSLPSADVVEVVRCNDCKNYNAKENKAYIAFCPVAEGIETIEPTDYCCWGERRETE